MQIKKFVRKLSRKNDTTNIKFPSGFQYGNTVSTQNLLYVQTECSLYAKFVPKLSVDYERID